MPVHAIGGIFFRARDPEALAAWYAGHLGVGPGLSPFGATEAFGWTAEGGPLIFAPFREETDYFPPAQGTMINFRVTALDEMIATLSAANIAVETRPEWDSPETGRFARVHDPEGNAIELWEAPA
ncbi:VOC family protein [Pseudoroseicyclus sp. CXY001]|uniref:VOC family protein n=1 Tax=Pseudoroseicyclus sp. CXY001 TaxID=3242492 RepID=UPI00358DC249